MFNWYAATAETNTIVNQPALQQKLTNENQFKKLKLGNQENINYMNIKYSSLGDITTIQLAHKSLASIQQMFNEHQWTRGPQGDASKLGKISAFQERSQRSRTVMREATAAGVEGGGSQIANQGSTQRENVELFPRRLRRISNYFKK